MATKKAAKKATTGVKPEAKLTKTTETKVKTVKATNGDFVNEITKPTFLATLVAELIGTFLLAAGVIATSGQPLFVFF